MKLQSWLLLTAALELVGCGTGSDGGRLEASWSGGPDTGRISAPAVARWCAPGHRLEVTAVLGDTGVGVVVYPTDSVRSGTYKVFNPTGAALRPGAAIAARWFTETAIRGAQGDSGTVTLETDRNGRLSGTVSAATLGVPGLTKGRMRGSFSDLEVQKALPYGCVADSLHPVKDSSVS
ncbi:MAG: hypothetical protein ABJD11_08945 [Gemmatimonadota bacterium]